MGQVVKVGEGGTDGACERDIVQYTVVEKKEEVCQRRKAGREQGKQQEEEYEHVRDVCSCGAGDAKDRGRASRVDLA